MEYHNDLTDLIKKIQISHEHIIHAVCEKLECSDRATELINELLDTNYSKVKAKKDPNRIKRAKSAYIFFCAEKRQEVTEKNPGKNMGDTSKILGSMWKKLTEEEKKPFVLLHEKDVERYEEEKNDE